jgi:glycosyltransferase involved in cell wall biosynthesis
MLNLEAASKWGLLDFEILVAADDADKESEATLKLVCQTYPNVQVLRFQVNDVGVVRKQMVKECRFANIFFIDADDLWSKNWLKTVLKNGDLELKSIYHPELTFFTSLKENSVLKSYRTRKMSWLKWTLLFENLWTSSFAIHKETFKFLNFKSGMVSKDLSSFAFEDWSFFRDAYYEGIKHEVVSNTFHVHYLKSESNTTLSRSKFPHPVDLEIKFPISHIKSINVFESRI